MPELVIDGKKTAVEEGCTILSAARKAGISIPTLCQLEAGEPFTSCMICVVSVRRQDPDGRTPVGRTQASLVPACSAPVENGMVVETDCEEVKEARREALELLLSEHSGDCEAPCRRSCPAYMNIPLMLGHIEGGRWREAASTVRNHIALPAVLGRICPAPCEKTCRRGEIDSPVAICSLKRLAADRALEEPDELPPANPPTGKRVAVVGSGPAGLSAAYYLLLKGHECHVIDSRELPGGALRYGVSQEILPSAVLDAEVELIRRLGASFQMSASLGREIGLDDLVTRWDAVILATGRVTAGAPGIALKNGFIDVQNFQTALEPVFSGGGAVRPMKMAVTACAHGRILAHLCDSYLQRKDRQAWGSLTVEKRRFDFRVGRLLPEELEGLLSRTGVSRKPDPVNEGRLNGDGQAGTENRLNTAVSRAGEEAGRCLHCECLKGDACALRELADGYGVSGRRYSRRDRRLIQRTGSRVIFEPGKCIKCGKCVRITEKHAEDLGLTFIGRGFRISVGVPLDGILEKGLEKTADLCIDACPTGALARRSDVMSSFEENVIS